MRVDKLSALLLFGSVMSLCWSNTVQAAQPVPGKIVAVHGEEAISSLYRFTVDIDAPNTSTALNKIIDQPISFSITKRRRVHGVVTSASVVGPTKTGALYRLVVEPKVADGLLTSHKRMYQEMSVIDVAEAVTEPLGVMLESTIVSDYQTPALLVQYGETDWEFVSRILEDNGIHYYFKHLANMSRLVLSDNLAATPKLRGNLDMARHSVQLAFGLTKHSGQVKLNDYDYRAPGNNLFTAASSPPYAHLVTEQYPGGYSQISEGQTIAQIRLGETRSRAFTYQGSSTNAQLTVGHSVTLVGHPVAQANQTYLITRVEHRLLQGKYNNQFELVPAFIQFRPARKTSKPIAVAETARVAGPPGEQITVDDHGRILVRFAWQQTNDSPIYARLSQLNSDSIWLPQIGEEVVITFIDGNPANPVVLGSLHNAQHMPPYELPASKYETVLKSKSHEIFMGDAQGKELLRLRSEHNLHAIAKNDQYQQIGRNQSINVGGNQKTSIARNGTISARTLTITAKDRLVLGVGTQRIVITNSGVTLPKPLIPKRSVVAPKKK